MKFRRLCRWAAALTFIMAGRLPIMGAPPAAEDLTAPPVTTAKAWAVADSGTGEVIGAFQPDLPLKSASTTKVMCAHVILELARRDPAILAEMVPISKLADATPGSTAGVRAGERVSVRDGLRGLLLPSGNDMGNAFAEHFHARLEAPGAESPADIKDPAFKTRRNFIAEMNRTAARLGMSRTKYRQAFGDGGKADDRTTTARDLLTLGHAAMQDPLFREIVSTAKYAGKALRPDGKYRTIEWENTNQLLKLANYQGIKTGMTDAAGYCLLSCGEHEGHNFMVVVLGCVTEEVRYADTRNLFRWAWRSTSPGGGAAR